mgnify:FL=1
MKKTGYIIFALITLIAFGTSCNKTKTYADLLKDEVKAIDKFIAKNKFVILDEFPKNGEFKSNELYRDPATGVYYNIIDVGDTTNFSKAKIGKEVNVRFKGLKYFSVNDSIEYNNNDTFNSPFAETFIYKGPVSYYTSSYYSGTVAGFAVPLDRVGRMGKVKMIVPFNMGSSSDQSSYTPTYYDVVQYTSIEQ